MYNLELNRVIEEIKKRKSKCVLIQLPDGLKQKANAIVDSIEEKTTAKILILFGSCYGGCDLPFGLNTLKIDLMIQWGHSRFYKEEW